MVQALAADCDLIPLDPHGVTASNGVCIRFLYVLGSLSLSIVQDVFDDSLFNEQINPLRLLLEVGRTGWRFLRKLAPDV